MRTRVFRCPPPRLLRERVPLYRSIRLRFVFMSVLALLGAFIVTSFTYYAFPPSLRKDLDDYQPAMATLDDQAEQAAERLRSLSFHEQGEAVRETLEQYSTSAGGGQLGVLLVDRSGHVLMGVPETASRQVDLLELIQGTADVRADPTRYRPGSAYNAYARVEMPDTRAYVIMSGVLAPRLHRRQEESVELVIIVAAFALIFFLLTRGKIRYVEDLADGLLVISRGRLDHRVREQGRDELGLLARAINRMAAELEQNIEAERRVERTKNELITGVSHDLRTPLTSVKGYLHLLHTQQYESPEQLARYVRIAYAKTEQLEELLDNLFEYTRLSGHEIRLDRQEVCLNGLLDQMVEEYVPLFESQELTFSKHFPDADLHLQADPDRLGRAFDNLLMNAVKYSDKPGEIAVSLVESSGGYLVTVQNRGPAIAPDDLEKIFAPFYRLDRSRSSSVRGAGLGLAIAKSIVELHGGRIWAESADGFVCFHVWLPFESGSAL